VRVIAFFIFAFDKILLYNLVLKSGHRRIFFFVNCIVSRFHSYVNSAASILRLYKGEKPFNIFLKSFFSKNKKFGSRDRKQISHLCYSYFRLGQAFPDTLIDEKILTALFLCGQHPNELLQNLKSEWNELVALPVEAKCEMLHFSPAEIFPWRDELSVSMDYQQLSTSFLIQPHLYIRVRPGKEPPVKKKLQEAGISFNEITHGCLRFDNSVQIDQLIELDMEAVVQDYNSQRVAEFLIEVPGANQLSIYDCCAGSGGKSILAYDVLANIQLTVSDIRESILINLEKRFAKAGIRNYSAFVKDLAEKNQRMPNTNPSPVTFDLVICDAPCTGSGTWSRTPEQLYFFNKERIDHYANLQQNILKNVAPLLNKKGHLLYITCSVFRKENEEMVQYLEKECKLHLKKMEMLVGYDKKADNLFAALLEV
jgi:16S rRNA (cytosine967-C5)-methyltransferase